MTYEENGSAAELDKFMRQCLREFPHVHSSLLKQMVATLAKIPPVSVQTTSTVPILLSVWGSIHVGEVECVRDACMVLFECTEGCRGLQTRATARAYAGPTLVHLVLKHAL